MRLCCARIKRSRKAAVSLAADISRRLMYASSAAACDEALQPASEEPLSTRQKIIQFVISVVVGGGGSGSGGNCATKKTTRRRGEWEHWCEQERDGEAEAVCTRRRLHRSGLSCRGHDERARAQYAGYQRRRRRRRRRSQPQGLFTAHELN